MKCHRSYLIADFENFSPGTLKVTVSVNEGSLVLFIVYFVKIEM